MPYNRRQFLQHTATLAAGFAIAPHAFATPPKLFFKISLAQWSLHKALFSKKLDTLDFPALAKNEFGIDAVEYVNQFFKDKAEDRKYLSQLLQRSKDNSVTNHLIMIDGEGDLGATDAKERLKAIQNHYKWVHAARYLGCKTIRVNAFGKGTPEAVSDAAAEGLTKLGNYAQHEGLNVIVENHGSYSSNGQWLLGVMKKVGKKNVGILPDFGNFCVQRDTGDLYKGQCTDEYDKYKGVAEWMPYAKGVSAKTFDFDAKGNCIETDYVRMLKIIKKSGFKGYMGIEYEGDNLDEMEGIRKTKALLLKLGSQLA